MSQLKYLIAILQNAGPDNSAVCVTKKNLLSR